MSSAAGAPFLAELNKAFRPVDRVAASFYDKRDPVCIVHETMTLGAQRRCSRPRPSAPAPEDQPNTEPSSMLASFPA